MADYAPVPYHGKGDAKSLQEWVERELTQIARTFQSFTQTQLEVLNVAPSKPREGMVVFADGTNWNPGSGRGFYGYRSGSWRKMD
jgi:hypothetical protein